MRTLFLGLAVATSVAFCPQAQASPQADIDGFFASLARDDLHGTQSDLLTAGRWVCQQVGENHFGKEEVAKKMLTNPTNHLDIEEALRFVEDSVSYLCAAANYPSLPVLVV
jgi:hypothetical protein